MELQDIKDTPKATARVDLVTLMEKSRSMTSPRFKSAPLNASMFYTITAN
jgi:hypothetical protein